MNSLRKGILFNVHICLFNVVIVNLNSYEVNIGREFV